MSFSFKCQLYGCKRICGESSATHVSEACMMTDLIRNRLDSRNSKNLLEMFDFEVTDADAPICELVNPTSESLGATNLTRPASTKLSSTFHAAGMSLTAVGVWIR